MKYTLRPGNIAAMLYVTEVVDSGRQFDCIYRSENKPVEVWPSSTVEIFPVPVRAAINKHFGTVFALPLNQRGAYLNSLVPWEVEG